MCGAGLLTHWQSKREREMFNDWDFIKMFIAIAVAGMLAGFALQAALMWLWNHMTIGWV